MSEAVNVATKLIEHAFTFVGVIISFILGIIGYDLKRLKDKLSKLNDQVIKLEATYIDENKVRDIIKEETCDIKNDISQINTSVNDIKNILVDIRIKQAKR